MACHPHTHSVLYRHRGVGNPGTNLHYGFRRAEEVCDLVLSGCDSGAGFERCHPRDSEMEGEQAEKTMMVPDDASIAAKENICLTVSLPD